MNSKMKNRSALTDILMAVIAAAAIFWAVNWGVSSQMDGNRMSAERHTPEEGSSGYGEIARIENEAEPLYRGLEALSEDVAQLQGGAGELAGGLDSLAQGGVYLQTGAEESFAALLADAQIQLQGMGLESPELTAENYAQALDGVLSGLDPASAQAQSVQALKNRLECFERFCSDLKDYAESTALAAGVAASLERGMSSLSGAAQNIYENAGRLRGEIYGPSSVQAPDSASA